jgi:toxin ParE1/3/4
MKPLILGSAAQAELDEAVGYYESKRLGLGIEFLDQVHGIFDHIRRFPKSGSKSQTTEYLKRVVRGFPYVIFYRELEQQIWVVAVAHGKRKPGYWQQRLKEPRGKP